MGITAHSIQRLKRHGVLPGSGGSMLELGAQNLYFDGYYGRIAKPYFESNRWKHTSWDITPHQGALEMDLRDDIPVKSQYDVVTDFGTTEHVSGVFGEPDKLMYYMAHKNIHNHCKVGGLIIHENPKTGHWPGHGCNYIDHHFYETLAVIMNYEIIELMTEYAMGNYTDGGNVCVVMKKRDDREFIPFTTFDEIPVYER